MSPSQPDDSFSFKGHCTCEAHILPAVCCNGLAGVPGGRGARGPGGCNHGVGCCACNAQRCLPCARPRMHCTGPARCDSVPRPQDDGLAGQLSPHAQTQASWVSFGLGDMRCMLRRGHPRMVLNAGLVGVRRCWTWAQIFHSWAACRWSSQAMLSHARFCAPSCQPAAYCNTCVPTVSGMLHTCRAAVHFLCTGAVFIHGHTLCSRKPQLCRFRSS